MKAQWLASVIAIGATIIGCSSETDRELSNYEYTNIACKSGGWITAGTRWGEYAEDMSRLVARVEALTPSKEMKGFHEAYLEWSQAVLNHAEQQPPDGTLNPMRALFTGSDEIKESSRALHQANQGMEGTESGEAVAANCHPAIVGNE